MANGKELARRNLEAFEVWQTTQTDEDFKQIIFKGKLNRIEVAKRRGVRQVCTRPKSSA